MRTKQSSLNNERHIQTNRPVHMGFKTHTDDFDSDGYEFFPCVIGKFALVLSLVGPGGLL